MTIAARLAAVRETIAAACQQASRPVSSVRLVAASKGQPAAAIVEAARAGQLAFGENYAREMREKREQTQAELSPLPPLEWHFIGRVQAGNARDIASAALVHGVGSKEQAAALARRGLARPIEVLLQLSLWGEGSKNGFSERELEESLPGLRALPGLSLRGFMAMPPESTPPRAAFAAVRTLKERLAPDLPEMSMGMSGDFVEAILEGATLIRVGTALFGPRARTPKTTRKEGTA